MKRLMTQLLKQKSIDQICAIQAQAQKKGDIKLEYLTYKELQVRGLEFVPSVERHIKVLEHQLCGGF